MKNTARNAFIVIATLALLLLLWEFRTEVVVLISTIAISAAVRPLVESFDLTRIGRTLALLLVYITIIAIIVFIFTITGDDLTQEIGALSNQLALTYERVYNFWPSGNAFQQAVSSRLPPPAQLYDIIGLEGQPTLGQVLLGATANIVTVLTLLTAVLVLSIYWSADRVHFERLWLSLLPVESRSIARNSYRAIEDEVGQYLRNMFTRLILAGFLLLIGLTLIEVPYPTLVSFTAAIFSLIPWLGVVLVIVPVAAAGLTVSGFTAAAGAIYTLAVLLILELVIIPRLFGRNRYSSLLMILIAILLAEAFGLLALVLAPPLAAGLQIAFRRSRERSAPELPLQTVRQIAELRDRVKRAREMIERTDEPQEQNMNMLMRLEKLVDEANNLLANER
jgi:putative permease